MIYINLAQKYKYIKQVNSILQSKSNMSAKQVQEIYQYIQSHGNFLGSQKILKQLQKNSQMVWDLVVKLISPIKNKNIQNAYAQMIFLFSDLQKHERSSKWLKQFMNISDLSSKMGIQYTIMDCIKPQKEKILNIICRIVQVSKGLQKLRKQLDEQIVREQQTSKQLKKQKQLQQSTLNILNELRERKLKQLPLYEQKLRIAKQLNEQIQAKRLQKVELLAAQNLLQDQIHKRQKDLEDLTHQEQAKMLLIQQYKKQIALNAPQVKKQKRAVEEQYHLLARQQYMDTQQMKAKIRMVMVELQGRNKFQDELVDNAKSIIQIIVNVNQMIAKNNKNKQENQKIIAYKNQLFMKQSQCKQEKINIQIQLHRKKVLTDGLVKQAQSNNHLFVDKENKSNLIKKQLEVCTQKFNMLTSHTLKTQNNIHMLNQDFMEMMRVTEQQQNEWTQLTETNLNDYFRPFESFDIDIKVEIQTEPEVNPQA